MDLADLSIRRPVFITCVIIVMLVVGWASFKSLPVNLFPNVEFPLVTVTVPYQGAGPAEIETLVSKPIEEEVSTVAGLKRLTSTSLEGTSQVTAEFHLGTNIQEAEQQVRDKVAAVRARLPDDASEPVIRRVDPSALPIITISLRAGIPEEQLYDLAEQEIKTRLEQVLGVGLVEIVGGRKREVHVELDRAKLGAREFSVQAVAARVGASGENVPSGTVNRGESATVFRTLGEFKNVEDIGRIVVDLFANVTPTRVSDLGEVTMGLQDEKTRVFANGEKALFLNIYKQSGANTIRVADGVRDQLAALATRLQSIEGSPRADVVRDSSGFIKRDVRDVEETILIGVVLTIVVVYFFLGSGRSTLITGLALPNSLLGAFILMTLFGFSVNIVTLLALSLAVGLLIDDAIVVRENIFRHIEHGEDPDTAARLGTREVSLAVIATTAVVISVFAPVAFMGGIIGQFMREFGLTICFAMAISLFDALTIAPMLSAYFSGNGSRMGMEPQEGDPPPSLWARMVGPSLRAFDRFQGRLEDKYETVIRYTLRRPKTVLLWSFVIFAVSTASLAFVPKLFLPSQDAGEFTVNLELEPGANLDAMTELALRADTVIRANKEVAVSAVTAGGRYGESNVASIYVSLVPSAERSVTTNVLMDRVRAELLKLPAGSPKILPFNPFGSGDAQPVNVNLIGENQEELEKYSNALVAYMKKDERVRDIDSSLRSGKPEFQIRPRQDMIQILGVNTRTLGLELRAQLEGLTPAKFREGGREYDVRVRVRPEQRDLNANFEKVQVPNVNQKLVRLSDIASPVQSQGPDAINRQDRGRFVQISASLSPGASLSDVLRDVEGALKNEIALPGSIRYAFMGDAENFQEMISSVSRAMVYAFIFIFLVLASLYESFVMPFTIMLALPLALCGAFLALFLAGESLSMYSILGIVMLIGIASKNAILLVDYTRMLIVDQGYERGEALVKAGRTRLRPILMTSMALIAGTLPVALGLNEAARERTSMGFAIIGGMISSTLLSLIVVPAAFIYVDRFRIWISETMRRLTGATRRRQAFGAGK